MSTYVIQSYDYANNTNYHLGNSTYVSSQGAAASFIGQATTLQSCQFYLNNNNASGSVYAKLYAMTGTYGNGKPTGSALATSDPVSVATGSYVLTTLTFSGANQYLMTAGTDYCISVEFTGGGNSSQYLIVGANYAPLSGGYGGNSAHLVSGTWEIDSPTLGQGLNFYVYGATVAGTVTTQACSSVTNNSAVGNGNITSTGGGPTDVTRRGFCYKVGTTGDPTTADSVVYDDGAFGTGAYTKAITGLTYNTDYRVRAYIINDAGTSYGNTVTTTTLSASNMFLMF